MAILSAEAIQEVVDEVAQWAVNLRAEMIEWIEESGYPYGAHRMTPAEQLQQYLMMRRDPEMWQAMLARLFEKHKGKPNVRDLVAKDSAAYMRKMETLRAQMMGESYGGGLL